MSGDLFVPSDTLTGREVVQGRRTRDGLLFVGVLWLGLGLAHLAASAGRAALIELVCGGLLLALLGVAWSGEPRRSRLAAHGSVGISMVALALLGASGGRGPETSLMLLGAMPIFILHQIQGRLASAWLGLATFVLVMVGAVQVLGAAADPDAAAAMGWRWLLALATMVFLGALGVSERLALAEVERRLSTRNGALRAAHERIRAQEAALREALAEAREQAVRDSLTGTFNRRWFDDALGMEVQRARRNQAALVLLVLDVDRFKRINDRCGHPVGDAVLRKLAELLQLVFRRTDMVCRLGGDEFAVLMPSSKPRRTLEAVERLLEQVRLAQVEGLPPGRRLAISVGWACFDARPDPDAPTYEGVNDAEIGLLLLRRADLALYEAKRRGGDAVVTEDQVPEGSLDSLPPVELVRRQGSA